ncbi:hypothetical protein Tco_0827633 [Tanacetum coccineum]
METQKHLRKDEDGKEMDVLLYRSMIGSLMYLTSSRLDIMFAVCACARYQLNPKVSHLHAMKRIFRYLKGQPKLGLWYPKDSPFDLIAYTDSDYAGASLDRLSTTGGYQFLGCRLISWQCKKQTVVANSTTEAEYVVALNCCGQVPWIQNQLLDYGDSNEKKLIQMIKIHTDKNVTYLITKAFDLQVLVDGKKIIITEATVRRDLQLEDADGVDCLLNATIFEQLTLMGAKTTAWNEFSSTMASTIICLATNQKFNFSKYIFESMVKNLDNAVKFLMYPRFVQVFLNNQLEGMATHNRIYIAPSHTKKIFANMRRQGKDFSGRETPLFPTMVVQAQEEMGEGSAMPTDPHHTPIITQPSSSQPQRKQKSRRRPKEKDTEIPQSSVPSDPTNIADEAVTEEPSMQLKELMDFCTKLQQRVLDLENTKTAQAQEITSLKKRVKRLEKKGGSRTHKLKRLYKIGRSARVVSSDEASLGDQEDASKQGRKIDDIDADAEITLVDETQGRHDDDLMFDTCVLNDEEVFAGQDMAENPTAATITNVELTLAQTLAELKSARPKTKGVVMQEPSESITTTTTTIPSKDKGKGIMVEEPLKMKKKDQISFDEQEAIRLQAEFDEEVRLAREKDKANVALIEEWNDIQAKIEADQLLAERLQAREQEELTIEERAKLFQQLLEKRRKFFAAKRAEEKRNKPPTKAQQRSIMTTYLKNMAGWKPKDLKNNETRKEESSKRAGEALEQESSKKQKVDDDQETTKLQSMMEVIPDEEEVAVDAIPLATKPLRIVDWKIIKEGKIGYYQIIRADGNSKRYSSMIQMLKSFDREDLETLWKLVKAKHGYTRPEEGYERVLWDDLKIMFEHNIEDTVWRNVLGNKVLIWKLFDYYGVHFVRFQDMHIFMLVEKRYPLTLATIIEMLNKKLQTDHCNEMYGDEVVIESEVTKKAGKKRNIIEEAVAVTGDVTIPVNAATITNVELTLAQTLAELKSARPKTKGVKGQGLKDKGKAKMIEPEKPLKKKDQIKFDEEEALRLQVKFDEEDRLVREKSQQVEEANIAWDDIKAKIDADYQLAKRLQAEEQ